MAFSKVLLLLLLTLVSLDSQTIIVAANGGATAVELWCVAKNNAEDTALLSALEWACGEGGSDCGPIQKGGPCYDPNDVQRTASYAFNSYFIKHGLTEDSCDFASTAALTSLSPSHGSCKFPSSFSVNNGSYTGSPANTSFGSSTADISSATHIKTTLFWSSISIAHLLYAFFKRFRGLLKISQCC